MKLQPLFVSIISLFFLPLICLAERSVQHYAAEAPASAGEAEQVLVRDMAKVSQILKQEELSPVQLEEVHKITYSMEAALKIIKPTNNSESFNNLAQTLEELHLKSEKHDIEQVKQIATKLNEMVVAYMSSITNE